ncbi:hypothetical protein [Dokdonella koreensis]|nr:hypothetical protein [Dokdonella koreensis]
MTFHSKTLGLLLSGLALTLAGCGGGGGDGGGATSPPQNGTITLSATSTSLPLNPQMILTSPGNPYTASVMISFRNSAGTLTSPSGDATVTTSNPGVAAVSFPDDPETDDINEMTTRWVTFPLTLNNGSNTFFVTAGDTAGTTVVTVSAVDPLTSRTVTSTLTFTVVSGGGTMPANIEMVATPDRVYMENSGGNTNSMIRAAVTDGGGQFVANPSNADNLRFEIVGSDTGAGRLVAGAQSGRSVTTATVNGIANVSFQAGSFQGPVQIRATADRSDNNVSNGIADPLSVTTTVVVSDGKLYTLKVTSPLFASELPGIEINSLPVDGGVTPEPGDNGVVIPPNPDSTLSLRVAVLATDRQGNPVLPGTTLRFGAVDAPVGQFGTPNANRFLIAGNDGNPTEGGNTFVAPTGQFQTAGGGAGPGDALVVFGKAVQGNADLETAVTVSSVNSQTSLTVNPVFNLNNTTGSSVNNGPVLPYLVGRAMEGNVTGSATTNDVGVAVGKLTYTVRSVGNAVALWAQGNGTDTVTGGARLVTDAVTLTYPGVAPASISAFPNPIRGNVPQTVTVCLTDALGIPLRGFPVGFAFQGLQGTGSIDGVASNGLLARTTDADGCVDGNVVTSGLPVSTLSGNSGQIVFTGAGASTTIDIIVQLAALQASPNALAVNCVPYTAPVAIRAIDQGGAPIANVNVAGTCSTGITVAPGSLATGTDGVASFNVTVNAALTGDGQCTFTATGTTRSVIVPVRSATGGWSPPPGGCSAP